MPARGKGRPSKLTALVIAKIAEAISYGLTDQEAADLVDVNIAQLTRWKRDRPHFRAAIKKQCQERLLFRLKTVEKGGPNWCGCAWILERMYPTRFSKPEVQLNINNTINQNTLHLSITAEEAKEIEALAEPVRGEVAQLYQAYKQQDKTAFSAPE
jgi:hypothetical protein